MDSTRSKANWRTSTTYTARCARTSRVQCTMYNMVHSIERARARELLCHSRSPCTTTAFLGLSPKLNCWLLGGGSGEPLTTQAQPDTHPKCLHHGSPDIANRVKQYRSHTFKEGSKEGRKEERKRKEASLGVAQE